MNNAYHQTHWFIVSKFEDDDLDYRILAGSINDFKSWERRFFSWQKAQVPETESGIAPTDPWYYFIPEEIDGELCQIVIKQSWTNYSDRSRRKVLNSICLIFPFSVLQTEPTSFFHLSKLFVKSDISNAILNAQNRIKKSQFVKDEQKFRFLLPREEDRLFYFKSLLKPFRLNYSSFVANHLCQKRKVCLIDSELPITSIEKRLQMLDAALLAVPYGSRATISAASWHYGSSNSVDSLVVGRYAFKDAFEVTLDGSPDSNYDSHLYSFHINEAINRGYSEDEIVSKMLSMTDITNLVEYTPHFPKKHPQMVIREHDTTYINSNLELIDNDHQEEENSNLIQSLINREVADGIEQSNILFQFEGDNNSMQELSKLADEFAKKIVLEFREPRRLDTQIWQSIAEESIQKYKIIRAKDVIRLHLLVLVFLEDTSLQEETANKLLEQFCRKLKEKGCEEELPLIHERYSKFINGILKPYKNIFKDEHTQEDWLNYYNILFSIK